MSTSFINETIKSFDYKKEAHFYKIKQFLKLDSKIGKGGVVKNLDWQNAPTSINKGPGNMNYSQELSDIDQIEIVKLLKLFSVYRFDMRVITKKISDNVYPPMQGISNEKAKDFCIFMNYSGLYIAKYWIRVILSNPEYFNVRAIFKNYM